MRRMGVGKVTPGPSGSFMAESGKPRRTLTAVSDRPAELEVATRTRIGAGLSHLQQRGHVDLARGVIAVIRGHGGQASGDLAVTVVAEELAGTDDVPAALAAAS